MNDRPYHSTISGKGALRPEAEAILRLVDDGYDADQIQQAVVEDDLLDRGTWHNRRTVLDHVSRRYFSGRDPQHIATLAHLVARCPNPTVVDLVLFYEYAQADALLYDLTVQCTCDRYQSARTAIDSINLNEWLTAQETEHPEITNWSPATRNKIVKSYLATIRDFGLVSGTKRKEFHKLFLPREAIVYALYHQLDRGLQGKALISSADWRLFLLSERETLFHLDEAARGGFLTLRYAGDIYDLRPSYANLHEVVHVLTS